MKSDEVRVVAQRGYYFLESTLSCATLAITPSFVEFTPRWNAQRGTRGPLPFPSRHTLPRKIIRDAGLAAVFRESSGGLSSPIQV